MAVINRRLLKEVEDIIGSAPGRLAVSIRLVGSGPVVDCDSNVSFPLASVYKVPLLATVFHKVNSGKISLNRRITLRESDKALGSDIQYFTAGMRLTVQDLCYLMIVHSDNTATDLIHRLIGYSAANDFMHSLGLDSIDIYVPNREYFFVFLGWSSRFKGMTLREISEVWKRMSKDEFKDLFAEIRKETRNKTAREAEKLGKEMWGIADEKETQEMVDASAFMDNNGSPADIAKLLELIVTRKIASRSLTEQMIEYMLLCDTREGLPSKIPEHVLVANKTGGVSGTVNDSAIIFASPKNTLTCACMSTGVKHADRKLMRSAIADIGLKGYEAFRR